MTFKKSRRREESNLDAAPNRGVIKSLNVNKNVVRVQRGNVNVIWKEGAVYFDCAVVVLKG